MSKKTWWKYRKTWQKCQKSGRSEQKLGEYAMKNRYIWKKGKKTLLRCLKTRRIRHEKSVYLKKGKKNSAEMSKNSANTPWKIGVIEKKVCRKSRRIWTGTPDSQIRRFSRRFWEFIFCSVYVYISNLHMFAILWIHSLINTCYVSINNCTV